MARVRPSAKGRSRPNVRSRKISPGLMEHRAMSSSISGISESSLQEPGWPSICAWLGSTIVQLVQFTTGIRSDWPNPPPGSASEHVTSSRLSLSKKHGIELRLACMSRPCIRRAIPTTFIRVLTRWMPPCKDFTRESRADLETAKRSACSGLDADAHALS